MSFRINHGTIQPSNYSQSKRKTERYLLDHQKNFHKILEEQIKTQNKDHIKVSTHANKRLTERSIQLTKQDLDKLNEAMEKLDKKGGRESLMLYKNTAYIANIRNRTLITVMDPQKSNEKIFTNIDSAVIVE